MKYSSPQYHDRNVQKITRFITSLCPITRKKATRLLIKEGVFESEKYAAQAINNLISEKKIVNQNGTLFDYRSKRITSTLNSSKDDISYVIDHFQINDRFSNHALQDAEDASQEYIENTEDRKDLRSLKTITIDGEDAKDLDDAVSITKEKNGWKLYVHIADVSHYVQVPSKLDDEAAQRGTSVYLSGTVIPMLPTALSNGSCSLNAHEDRYGLTVELFLDKNGITESSTFYTSIIHVDQRYTYDEIEEIINKPKQLAKRDIPFVDMVENLCIATKQMLRIREARGAINFDLPETKFQLDESGVPLSVKRVPQLFSQKVIEECMLKANEAAARALSSKKIGIYRVHETPAREDMDRAARTFHDAQLPWDTSYPPKSIEYQRIARRAMKHKNADTLQIAILRSLPTAYYSCDERIGHFGLGMERYTHFTSPIRRYPDLIVHRLIKSLIIKQRYRQHETKILPIRKLKRFAFNSSIAERRAVSAERMSIQQKSTRYLQRNKSQIFAGRITGIPYFGVFVSLKLMNFEVLCAPSADPKLHIAETGQKNPIAYYGNTRLEIGLDVDVMIDVVDTIKYRVSAKIKTITNLPR